MFLTVVLWLVLAVYLPLLWLRSKMIVPRSKYHGEPTNSQETPCRRSLKSGSFGGLVTGPSNGALTAFHMLQLAVKVYGSKPLFGQRDIRRIVVEEKQVVKKVAGVERTETKQWKHFELSPYSWMSYLDVNEAVLQIGAGLRHLGLQAKDKLTIFAPTCRDWMLMAHGCFTQGITITTAYDTLGEEGLGFSLNEGEITTLYTSAELIPMMPSIAARVPTLKNVIFTGFVEDPDSVDKTIAECTQLNFYTIRQLRELGVQHPVDPVAPKQDDVACIMYTSGSTGNPKGVLITHANIMAALGGAEKVAEHVLSSKDVYLAYLPLAHILEFLIENVCILFGVSLGYGTVKTLTDASVRNCAGDIRELRPTLMAGVPAVWEGIRKGIVGKLNGLSPIQRYVFDLSFKLKWHLKQLGLPTTVIDKTIFKKIKDSTGGRLRYAISGGAPIPKETHHFLTTVLCDIIQGYGMTETCGFIAIQDFDQSHILGCVGNPSAAMEVKLVTVADSKYTVHNVPKPQGEIWVRGPVVTDGYYKQPQVTAETITKDGWLMTGDIGEFNPDGSINIIDRKKNLIKLSNGEYIALEKLESTYKTSDFVQHICIHADPHNSYATALIVPVEKEIIKLARDNKLVEQDSVELAELEGHEELNRLALRHLVQLGKSVGLKPAELLGGVYIVCKEDWTPQNGLLTAAMKLKRRDIFARYDEKIKNMY